MFTSLNTNKKLSMEKEIDTRLQIRNFIRKIYTVKLDMPKKKSSFCCGV